MILAYLEHSGKKLSKSTLAIIGAAKKAKEAHAYSKVIGLFLGSSDVQDAANEAASYGLDEVVYVQADMLDPYLSMTFGEVMIKAVEELSPTLVLASANARGKDLMPRLSQYLNAGQASDVIAFVEGGIFRRPMYAGNILADVELTTDKKTATLRATSFEPAEKTDAVCSVRELQLSLAPVVGQEFISFDSVDTGRPELTEADVVVSAGRAIKSAENFEKHIEPLADVLGAAIGSTRAAVDAGYAPNDWQVGQTGKVVAPELYIALGISGAIQHLAGMKDSKVIVAVNKDSEAPIFEVSDYGIVADLFDIVPELTEALRKAKS